MKEKRLPKSLRKYIRKEKARIRREVLEVKEQERLIQELYQKIFEKLKIKTEIEKDYGEQKIQQVG